MQYDIVTRLRDIAESDVVYRTMIDAAFEIENLRAQLRQAETERDGWIRQAMGRD